jgi:hypothetical protein
MKKALWAAGIAALLLGLAGCSLNDNTAIPSFPESPSASVSAGTPTAGGSPSPDAQTPDTETDDSTQEPSGSPEQSPPAGTSPSASSGGAESTGGSLSPGDALLKSDGIGKIRIGMTEDALIGIIGEPISTTIPSVWGSDDLVHSEWNYEPMGIIINMAQQPGKDEFTVFSIKAMAPCSLKTSRGIAIGDSKAAVLEAYGNEYNAEESDDNALVLGSVYGGMVITVDDEGEVVEIFIGSAAE